MLVVGQTLPALPQRVVLVAAALVAVVAGVAFERRAGHRPVAALRRRLLLGVPWGTLVTVGLVFAVYLFLQGGWGAWRNPVVVPFRAWSYFEPLGIVTAAFGHAGPGHLVGNLVGTLAFAPLVEYAWGHFPEERGTHVFGDAASNPYVRAFLVFPAAVVAVGVGTAAFALGPVIGFSGVVFAFAGFALVYYPLSTVAALTVSDGIGLVYRAVRDPSLTASGRPAFVTPWWADVAIQGHALGLLTGVVLAGWLAHSRGRELPGPGRLFVGALLVAVGQNLWAVYWFLGGGEYVLFRAVGLALVFLLAVLVAAVGVGSGTALSARLRAVQTVGSDDPDSDGSDESDPRGGDKLVSAGDDDPDSGDGDSPLSFVGPAALLVLVLVVAAVAGPAVPANLLTVDDDELPGEPVEIRGYSVTYAEDVQNGMVSVIDVGAFGLSTDVNTSGVIVRNPDRHVWTTVVSKGRLAFAGRQRAVVGGVGWREEVTATRRGLSAVGGSTAYRVTLAHAGEERLAYHSEPARAEPRVAGWNVSLVATDAPAGAASPFRLNLTRGNESVSAPVPTGNESVTAGGVRFVREDRAVVAVVGNTTTTRVRVASTETYRDAG
jgi:membrane associated rhomboid family serine protease